MGQNNTRQSNLKKLKTLVIGCTPLARKVAELTQRLTNSVGIVNLDPSSGSGKCNYDAMFDFEDEVFYTKDINDKKTIQWIKSRNPDVIIQCGWSQIFNKKVLSLAKKICIGIHPSPLPIGRGAAIINWKIIEGSGRWGNTLFQMEPTTDTGDILDFEPFDIENRDDVRTAYFKVDRTALKMLKRTLPKIAGNSINFLKQDSMTE